MWIFWINMLHIPGALAPRGSYIQYLEVLLRPFYYDLVSQYCYYQPSSTIKKGNRIRHALDCLRIAVGKDDGRYIAQGTRRRFDPRQEH